MTQPLPLPDSRPLSLVSGPGALQEEFWGFLARTELDPDLVDGALAGRSPDERRTFQDLFLGYASMVGGVRDFGRIGVVAEAAARSLIVLRSATSGWWDDQRRWPPPPQPTPVAYEIMEIAEVLAAQGGGRHYVHVEEGRDWTPEELPTVLRLALGGQEPTDRFETEVCREVALRKSLADAVDLLTSSWLDEPVSEPPTDEFWAYVGEHGIDVLEDVRGFFVTRNFGPQLRHATRQLVEAGVGRDLGGLVVPQAARIVLGGRNKVLLTSLHPESERIPLRLAAERARHFLARTTV